MGAGVRSRRVAALVVVAVASAWLVSPPDDVRPDLPEFGSAVPDRPAPTRVPGDVDRPSPAPPTAPVAARPARTVGDAFGAFVGDDDLGRVERYESALGLGPGETLGSVLRYAAGSRRGGWDEWRASVAEALDQFSAPDQPRRLVLSLPMLVPERRGPGDPALAAAGLDRDPGTLAAGAAGAYDDQWRWLGEALVAAFGERLPHRVLLRPGWEANGSWYRWSYGTRSGYDPALAGDYALYWRRVHDVVMGPVREAGTSVGWVLNASAGAYRTGGLEAAWPGDDYVDVVSLDLYQNHDFRSTDDFGAAAAALRWLEAVGAARDKLVAIDETSVSWRRRDGRQVGGGDNALWFSSLRGWADRVVAERRLSHLMAFESDTGRDDLFAPVFPEHPERYSFPQARADLIASFGGPRSGPGGVGGASA